MSSVQRPTQHIIGYFSQHWMSQVTNSRSLHRSLRSGVQPTLDPSVESFISVQFRVIDYLEALPGISFWSFEFAASNSTHMPSRCCCLSTLNFPCTTAFSSCYRFLSLPFASLFSLVTAKVLSEAFCFFSFATWCIPWFIWLLPAGLSWYLSRDLLGLLHPMQRPMP